MKIAIMQPYLFPYLGYFQLMHAVDQFGIGDDVQYIKSGWINRNNILVNNQSFTFTFPVKNDSSKKMIKERYFHESVEAEKGKLLRILTSNYNKAPFFNETMEVIEKIINLDELNISIFLKNHLRIISEYVGISTNIVDSHKWAINNELNMGLEERVIKKLNKLRKMGITKFVNPIGGNHLYSKGFFIKNNFELLFLSSNETRYDQFGKTFVPNLSIIDVMMFNSKDQINGFLNNYSFL